jgi:WD40 repeat protein
MASTLSASATGLEIVDRARQKKDWTKAEVAWQVTAEVSKSTLDRFWMQTPIKRQNFKAICTAVGVDWEQAIDELPEIEPTKITRKSNLAQGNQPVVLELEEFGQQIFDWFGALDFKFEGLPRQEGKYVEWVIQVPVRRSRFDRVLIRATIHEAGLSDLDSLRRGVAQLRVDEGWLVTNLWVSQSVRQALIKSDDEGLTCLTFDELIDQDANFTPYLEWLEREISKREIDRYYVDLGCTKGEFDADTRTLRGTSKYSVKDGGIDRYIDRWLKNPVTEHVSILGEFGTGKTWFAFHYAGKCLQAYRDAKSKGMPRPRLPLVIPLRDYAKALNVENVLAGFFYTQHNIRLNSDVFDRLNRMGKLLLIFDGFDEMADKTDTQKMIDNFWELAKVVTPNAKVILTSREEHFVTAQDERDSFSGEKIPSTANKIAVAPKFETLKLMKLDDEQIRAVLSRRTNLATVELVMANSQLLDLLRRAVMAEFVLEALPEIEAGKSIDLARVYLYAVRHKMERDITTGRTFTSLADKLYFLCELAWEMLSEDKMSLNYREFPDRLQDLFGKEVADKKHLDHWHYDMMGQTMLIRNDDGDYSPAHRSLLEFFVAYKFAAELGLLADDFLEVVKDRSGIDRSLTPQFYTWSKYWRREVDNNGERKLIAPLAGFKSESLEKLRGTFGKSPLTEAILDLLLPAISLEVKYRESNQLLELIKSTKANQDEYLGGNIATVLVRLNSHALDCQDLSNTNLAYANLVNAGLRQTNISGANLENCIISNIFRSTNAIVMSKDDRRLITAHDGKAIIIWDRYSGRELQRLADHDVDVSCLVLSDDGELLYSASKDGTIKEWSLVDGICQRTFDGEQKSVMTIALSNDGDLLYSGGSDGTVKEWRLADGICQHTFEIKEIHQKTIVMIVINRGGILYLGGMDGTVKVWSLFDDSYRRTLHEHNNWVSAIVPSHDGKFVYVGGNNGIIKEWKLSDGSCQRIFNGHKDSVNAIVVSLDGLFIYSGSHDQTIKEWSLLDGNCQRTFEGHTERINALSLSRDGKYIYSSGRDQMIKEWDLSEGTCLKTLEGSEGSIHKVALSRNGKFLYSGHDDGTIKEWNLLDGNCQRTITKYQSVLRSIALSADGNLLYSGHDDGTINEWNLLDGKYRRALVSHEKSVDEISISEDGEFLYSGSGDKKINKWQLLDGSYHTIYNRGSSFFRTIYLSEIENGNVFYFSDYGEKDFNNSIIHGNIVAFRITDRTRQCTFSGHEGLVSAITVSSNKKFLYSGSADRTIKEWNLNTGECLRTFEGHQKWVHAIALSDSGQLLYSASRDGTIKEWDLSTGNCLRTIDTRLCAGANITNVKGLTPAQTDALLALGAFSDDR